RIEWLRRGTSPAAARIREEAARRMSDAGAARSRAATAVDAAGELLAYAFPDRIAMRRPNGKYVLTSGRGAEFTAAGDEPMMREPFLAIAELDGAGTDSRIRAAAPLSLDALKRVCAERIRIEEDVAWDDTTGSVRARRRVLLDAIQLEE